MGQVTFGIPRDLVRFLLHAGAAPVLVETGTNQGKTSRWAAAHFEQVITIEGYRPLYDKVSNDPTRPPNVKYLFGDSRALLCTLIAGLNQPAIFWLDAHWCGEETFGAEAECPVLEEIAAVNAQHFQQPGHIVLVDDARLFFEPPPAPHRAQDWPDISAVCAALTAVPGGRYVFVHRDVIVAVPPILHAASVDYLRMVVIAERAAAEASPRTMQTHISRAISAFLGRIS